MSDDQFNTIFRYMTQHFARIEKELENKADKSQLNQILNTLDGIIARLDQDNTERAALAHQVNRHEGWIKQVAKKTDSKLKYS